MASNKLQDVGILEAERIFKKIVDDFPELDEYDERQSMIVFALFAYSIQYLHDIGWSEKELINEVFDHCQIARE